VCAFEDDPSDENHELLKENFELLKQSGFRVIKLPMPGFVGDDQGRLPASYANFYIGNGAIVVPQFGHANDQRALDILRDCFPGRRIVGVNCTAMVHGLGTIHCCSQQEPRRTA
jgi:agmatine deiminase